MFFLLFLILFLLMSCMCWSLLNSSCSNFAFYANFIAAIFVLILFVMIHSQVYVIESKSINDYIEQNKKAYTVELDNRVKIWTDKIENAIKDAKPQDSVAFIPLHNFEKIDWEAVKIVAKQHKIKNITWNPSTDTGEYLKLSNGYAYDGVFYRYYSHLIRVDW